MRAPEFASLGAGILGASFDSPKHNAAFARRLGLGFELVSDEDASVGEAYEVKREPGERSANRPRRTTYLIDPSGVVSFAWKVSGAGTHPEEVLEVLREKAGRG